MPARVRHPFFAQELLVKSDNAAQRGFVLVLRFAFMGSSSLRCSVLSSKFRQTNRVGCSECSVLAGFLPVSFLPFSSFFSPVACRRHRRLLLLHVFSTTRRCFLTPPPSRRFFLPKSSGCLFWFLYSRPRLSALREKEQANRAHHTLHVSVPVMFSVLVFVTKRWLLFFCYVVPRCIWLR